MEYYELEIKQLREKMDKAKEFAEHLPCFKEIILTRKLDSNFTGTISKKYKDIYLEWGINRYFYKDNKNITNCDKEIKDSYLFNIYINTLSLYDSHEKYGLKELKVPCFFFDKLNTTFYIEEKDIEIALEILNDWYNQSRKLAFRDKLLDEKEKLTKRLAYIENQLEEFKES